MNGLDPMVWSALLTALGCLLIVLEVFIPSGGILGFLAVTSVFSALALAFYHHGPVVGFGFVVVAVVALPVSLGLAIKFFPQTPMGRRLLLSVPTEADVSPDDDRQRARKQLLGRVGTAKTPMLPSGSILIDRQTVDAVSQGMVIEAGQRVVVVEVKGNRVVVRPVDDEGSPAQQDEDDVLSRPLDALGLDALDEPLS